MRGWAANTSAAAAASSASTSAIERSCTRTASVSCSKRSPPQTSQRMATSGRKLISSFFTPWPAHSGQRPSSTLKEKRLGP